MHKPKRLPIGQSSFEIIRSQNYYWVDKSRLIQHVIDNPANVILLPRPRRFGKTLNMDMLRCFFSNDADRSNLFTGSWIAAQPDYWQHQGQYPVISLTLKDVKHSDWTTTQRHIQKLITRAAITADLAGKIHDPQLDREYNAILSGAAEQEVWQLSLKTLIQALAEYHQKPVVVLIDEYDTPIHTAYLKKYFDELIDFFRIWLGSGLKDQTQLYRGVITGIMRVAKESMFSGLNNFKTYPVHDGGVFSDSFGFTQAEVEKLLADHDLSAQRNLVSDWYNGYQFDDVTIYNPWSILNYIDDFPKPPKAHWINTSANDLAYKLIQQGSNELKYELEQLLNGAVLAKPINDAVVLGKNLSENDVWSFLLATGYLTSKNPHDEFQEILYDIFIPNQEIQRCYSDIIRNWFDKVSSAQRYRDLIMAFIKHDFVKFEQLLQEFVLALFSYHDLGKDKPAEAVIQAFVLGLLASLTEDFRIRSNRETGLGRADLLLEPNDKTQAGFVLEFKAINPDDDIDTALNQALQQTEVKHYQTELQENGIQLIFTLAIVLQGKTIKLRVV